MKSNLYFLTCLGNINCHKTIFFTILYNYIKTSKLYNTINITYFYDLRSVYGSTNPYAHIISMLLNRKATINVGIKQDVEKIPIYLTLNEVSIIKYYLADFA